MLIKGKPPEMQNVWRIGERPGPASVRRIESSKNKTKCSKNTLAKVADDKNGKNIQGNIDASQGYSGRLQEKVD